MSEPRSSLVYAVDDERDNLELLDRTLGAMCRLRTFAEAATALAAARVEPPSLLLLDYRMPGSDGGQLLHEMRAIGITCGVILLTGFPENEEIQKLVATREAMWVVAKPWSPDRLRSQVRMALSLSPIRARLSRSDRP